MGRAATIERALRDVVDLREAAALTADGEARRRLEAVVRRRLEDVGPTVPKTAAAGLLGVSVTALDRWVRRGRIPVARRASSTREEVDTRTLVELTLEARALRAAGRARGVLAGALATRAPRQGMRGFFPDHLEELAQLAAIRGES